MKTTVILIRHAEKLEWIYGLEPSAQAREEYQDNHKLSPKGYERAHALVGYFTSRKEMVDLFKERPLSLVIAQDIDSVNKWGKSDRPRETIWPLLQYQKENCTNESRSNIARNLELRLLIKANANQISRIIRESGKSYENKSILICWCHQQLPMIAKALGVDNAPKWPKGRFDVTWIIEMDKGGEMSILPQNLVFGDNPNV